MNATSATPRTNFASTGTQLGSTKSVVVIGGGIGGLAAAGLLAREGHRVTLVEALPAVGGRAGTFGRDGFRWDMGPSWYLMPEVFDHFYKLMGTSSAEQLELVKLDPAYSIYFEGETAPVHIAATRQGNLDLFESIETGAGAKLDKYLLSAEDTYEIAKRRFLYTSFQSLLPVLRKDVLSRVGTLVRLLTESIWKFVCRTVENPKLRKILAYPAVFLGSSPFITPSMFHLMSHLDLSDGVLYPMGGLTRVIETIAALAEKEGVTILTNSPVKRIIVDNGEARGVVYMDADGRLHAIKADLVVSATDLHHSETTMLEPKHQTFPEKYWKRKVAGPSAILLYLGVKGELPQLEHHTLLFSDDWHTGFDAIFGKKTKVPDPASLYVCKPSALDRSTAPDGHENLFVLVPIPADPSIGRGAADGFGDAELERMADRVIQQIADWTGIPDLADRITVRRTVGPKNFRDELGAWKGTALGPAHTLRQSAFFRSSNVSKKVKGLYYVGSSTIPGIGLPMCLISAEVLLKRLRGDTSTEPLQEPAVPVRASVSSG